MTPEEINNDIQRFAEYLKANNVPVYAFMMLCDGVSFAGGVPEMQDELYLRMKANRLGFRLVDK